MSGPLSGPGLGLQPPQNLYPSELANSPYDASSNEIGLAAGDQFVVPRGDWLISLGSYCLLQYLDPVNNNWRTAAAAGWTSGLINVSSDGFSVRVANMTGCPVGGIVNSYGTGWVQASTTIAVVGGGGSTWQAIVGGQLALVGGTLTSNGAGYGVAPMVFIPPPPGPSNNPNGVGGVQATGFCTIASGTVSGFTFTNVGAGYPTAPTPVIVPNPTDPNITTGITAAVMAFSLTGSGSITSVRNTNPGAPLATPNNITLTIAGAGASATISPIMCQTVLAVSVTGGTTLTGSSVAALVTSAGGYPLSAGPGSAVTPTGTVTSSPVYLLPGAVSIGGGGGYGLWARPRPLQCTFPIGALGTMAAGLGTIYDGGLFYSVPTPILSALNVPNAVATFVGQSTLALVMGSRPDIIWVQPLKV